MKNSGRNNDDRLPARAKAYPQLRIMGNKFRLMPWIGTVLSEIEFDTCLDAFSGSGCVGYMMKCMGKSVTSNDFLKFSYHISNGLIANENGTLSDPELTELLKPNRRRRKFISTKFKGIFFNDEDNRFLDNTWANLQNLSDPYKRSSVIAALCRSCLKKQPRGVFTTATANNGKYDDGRRDLRLPMKEHFRESIALFNSLVFANGKTNRAFCADIFDVDPQGYDLVYMDPPYVPRSDDNCYIKRYHFLEGLSCYWQGQEIVENSVVKKIKKKHTPFSYRRESIQAFRELFNKFKNSILVLSYSSNGYPGKAELRKMLQEVKGKDNVSIESEHHTYHFGTHQRVSDKRKHVEEYLLIGV